MSDHPDRWLIARSAAVDPRPAHTQRKPGSGSWATHWLGRALLLFAIGSSSALVRADDPGLPQARAERVGMSSERLARIDGVLQRYIDQELVAGTVALIARRGRVVYFAARGAQDAATGAPMRADAIFRIASMTKPVASVALMQLWEQGRFQLRDPVAKYLPEFADQQVSLTEDVLATGSDLRPVQKPSTIRQMLTHTAGLANSYRGNVAGYRATFAAVPGENLAQYTRRLAALPLNYEPGTQWQYSTATSVVGRLVEVLSGQPLDEYLQQHIFAPLAMHDTQFYLEDTRGGRLTAQYQPGADDNKIVLQDPGTDASRFISGPKTMFSGSGGLLSTARDYVRFQQMMLNGGKLGKVRILAPTTVSLMLENHTADMPLWLPGPGVGFGLGYGVVRDRGAAATPLSVGSAYWGGAYSTLSWFDPKEELVAVLMTQVRPYSHLNLRQDFQVLTYQAIIESNAAPQ